MDADKKGMTMVVRCSPNSQRIHAMYGRFDSLHPCTIQKSITLQPIPFRARPLPAKSHSKGNTGGGHMDEEIFSGVEILFIPSQAAHGCTHQSHKMTETNN